MKYAKQTRIVEVVPWSIRLVACNGDRCLVTRNRCIYQHMMFRIALVDQELSTRTSNIDPLISLHRMITRTDMSTSGALGHEGICGCVGMGAGARGHVRVHVHVQYCGRTHVCAGACASTCACQVATSTGARATQVGQGP